MTAPRLLARTLFAAVLSFSALPGCAGLNKFLHGEPADRVTHEVDKFTGKSTLRGHIRGASGTGDYELLDLAWEDGAAEVRLSWLKHDFNSRLLRAMQSIAFDVAADGKPVPHEAPEHQVKLLNVDWSDLQVSIAIPVDEVRKLAGATQIETRICGWEGSLTDFELQIVQEFARRLEGARRL